MRRPVEGLVLATLAAVAVACTGASGAPSPGASSLGGPPSGAAPTSEAAAREPGGSFVKVACSLPHDWLLRTWRGWRADRGGEIQILPREYSLIDPGLPHVGPWDYAQQIPMLWYGPGVVSATGAAPEHTPATLADIAPTQAALLGFAGFHAPDGHALLQAGSQVPRLVVTLVWDAAGTDVLQRWPGSWPVLRSLRRRGVWFPDATVGSSPTQTAQSHATIGTGAFPRHNGILSHRLRVDGVVTTPWADGPSALDLPTLADVYDRAMGNRPQVGEVATLTIHLGMLGHGAAAPGGDRDTALLHESSDAVTLGQEGADWNLLPEVAADYTMPAWANHVPGFAGDVQALDRADGRADGHWGADDIAQLLGGWDTPARIPYQTRVIEELIRRDGYGADEVPDLLFLNYKLMDYVAHTYGIDGPEMRDSLRAQDAALSDLVGFLDAQVGQGRWAMVLVADHGAAPSPQETGGTVISSGKLEHAIETTFDADDDATPVVDLIQATELYVNTRELAQNGFTVEQVARFVGGLTAGQIAVPGQDTPPDQRVFRASYPSSVLEHLPCLPEAA